MVCGLSAACGGKRLRTIQVSQPAPPTSSPPIAAIVQPPMSFVDSGSVPPEYPATSSAAIEAPAESQRQPQSGQAGRPVCTRVGTRSEGWAWPDGRFILWSQCKGKKVQCVHVGTDREGWYASDSLIATARCGNEQTATSHFQVPQSCIKPKISVFVEPSFGEFRCVCHRQLSKSNLRDGRPRIVNNCGPDNCTGPRFAIVILNCLEKAITVLEAKMTWRPSAGGSGGDALFKFDLNAMVQSGDRWNSELMSTPANGAGEIETSVTIEVSSGVFQQVKSDTFHVREVFTTLNE